MSEAGEETVGAAGAYGVNYALRPHKFIDRRIFIEVLSKYSNFEPLDDYVYVGLGSFALEDHKLINASFATQLLISLEIENDVLLRQIYNSPLACIKPTLYSTTDFVINRAAIFEEHGANQTQKAIIWFDMTDAVPLRVHLDTFRDLLKASSPGDVIRYTVDVDHKTLVDKIPEETLDDRNARLHDALKEQLSDQYDTNARAKKLSSKLAVAQLVVNAFRLIAEEATDNSSYVFEPVSIVTYADGHRMLSITGVVLEETRTGELRDKVDFSRIPGGAKSWSDLVNIEIPQLTVWERLSIDKKVGKVSAKKLAEELNFKLHESISTEQLLKGYETFQRFYPNFRHVLL